MEKHESKEEVLRQAAYGKSPTLEKFLGPVEHPDVWQAAIYKAAEEPINLADKYLGSQTMGIMADFLIEGGVEGNLFDLDLTDRKSVNYLRMLSAGIMVIGWDLVDEPELLAYAEPEVVKRVSSSFSVRKEHQGRKVVQTKAFVKGALSAGKIMKRTFNTVYAFEKPQIIEGTVVSEGEVKLTYPDGPIGGMSVIDVFLDAFKDQASWPVYDDQNQRIGFGETGSQQHEDGV